jgi:sporulation protein YlmC with PRC-barrel domain
VNLVRDVLDRKLVDTEDCDMGRVDGIVMQMGEHSQPRITHIVIGGTTPWMRLHPMLAKLAKKLARTWGPRRAESVRIPWSRVVTTGKDIRLDVKARETGAIDWEIWIARHIIERIPGGGQEEAE